LQLSASFVAHRLIGSSPNSQPNDIACCALEARAFEELRAEILARLGAVTVRLTPEGQDRGVDIWATVRILTWLRSHTWFQPPQSYRYIAPTDPAPLRELCCY
jgi:hypothetical protein